jgi:hypothetical protein
MSFSSNSEAPEQVTRNYKGQFASLKFPKRVYQEYPKVIRDPAGAKIGRATNAMEEAEILAKAGLEVGAVDPIAAMKAELTAAKEKLAQYEGADASKQIAAKKSGAQTQSVEMLPVREPEVEGANAGVKENPAEKTQGNPLLGTKPPFVGSQGIGAPQPVGTAPKVSAPLKSGV